MSKPVMITTDSTCDLPQEMLDRFNFKTVPLHIILGDEEYLDGKNFTPDDIYARYEKDKMLPRTAAVSPQEFTAFFGPIVAEGYEIVHIDISSDISGTYQNAVIASGDFEGISPIDGRHLSTGTSQLVLAACRMRDAGMDAASIAEAVKALIPKVNTSFVLDTLEYMWKGGRCTGVTAFGANLLNLKPCLEMREGKLEVCKKYRGNIFKVYEKYIAERLEGLTADPHAFFVTSSLDLPQEVKDKLETIIRSKVNVDEICFYRTGCTVTSHCGPGTMGILFLEA